MGNNTFNHTFNVAYSEISSKGTLKISGLANYFQSLAVAHSDAAGWPVEKLMEQHRGWILLHYQIKIKELPRDNEQVTAHTWAAGYRRAQADRDFCLCDSEGNELAYASSRWVVMDIDRRRPAKLDPDFFSSYSIEGGRDVAEAEYKITIPEEAEEVSRDTFTVKRRDTDTNGHVNNAIYIDWAIDSIPDDLYDNGDPSELRITYKKECRRGARVMDICRRYGNKVYSTFVDADDPEKVFCIVYSDWD